MDDLIFRVLSGAGSPFEEERLRRWREESGENEELYQEVARVWELTAPEPGDAPPGPPDVQHILALAESLRRTEITLEARRGRRSSWRRWGLVAASVAALSFGLRVAGIGVERPRASFEAPLTGTITVNLEDGSFVRLAPGSRLQEWEDRSQRIVSLEGRGFFAVARDEGRPFVVRGEAAEVRVLGTRFELSGGPESVRAVVLEGRVQLSNAQGSVEVERGEVAVARPDFAPEETPVADVYALLDWPGGTLVFQGTPLEQVAFEVTRRFGRALTVEGEGVSGRRITAWFQDESFEEVAEALCLAAGAVCRMSGEGVVMADQFGEGNGR